MTLEPVRPKGACSVVIADLSCHVNKLSPNGFGHGKELLHGVFCLGLCSHISV